MVNLQPVRIVRVFFQFGFQPFPVPHQQDIPISDPAGPGSGPYGKGIDKAIDKVVVELENFSVESKGK